MDTTRHADRVLLTLGTPAQKVNDYGLSYRLVKKDGTPDDYLVRGTGVVSVDAHSTDNEDTNGTITGYGESTAGVALSFRFVDAKGQDIVGSKTIQTSYYPDDPTLTNLRKAVMLADLPISGHTLRTTNPVTVSGDTYTYHYVSPTDINGHSGTATPVPNTSSLSSSSNTVMSSPNRVVAKGIAIYVTKKVGLDRHANFDTKNRELWYSKQDRAKRPQFVVTGYAHTKKGTLRDHVRDLNHHTKSNGRTGYLTTLASLRQPTTPLSPSRLTFLMHTV